MLVYIKDLCCCLAVCNSLDVTTEKARRGVINEVRNVGGFVLISETVKDLKERLWNWKEALENKL